MPGWPIAPTSRPDGAIPPPEPGLPWLYGLPPEWQGSLPKTEKEIGAYFDAQFSEQFEICPEVWLKDFKLNRFRIDRVLRDRHGRVGGLWGVELKRPPHHESFTCFTRSLAQAMDYTQARIDSDIKEHPDWFGQPLRFAFQFPCTYRIYEFETSGRSIGIGESWAQGALKLAAKFGVGAISWSAHRRDWGFFLAGHPFYWLRTGPTDAAQKHMVATRRGSAR